jgi:hypothetical protein
VCGFETKIACLLKVRAIIKDGKGVPEPIFYAWEIGILIKNQLKVLVKRLMLGDKASPDSIAP